MESYVLPATICALNNSSGTDITAAKDEAFTRSKKIFNKEGMAILAACGMMIPYRVCQLDSPIA